MIQHVALEVAPDRVEACAAFYRLLGFADAVAPESLRQRAVWLSAGETQVHLLLADAPVAPPQGHVAVVVSDYEATVRALRGAGFEVDPRTPHWGSPRAFARDPAGHRVEIMAFPPPAGLDSPESP